ncbi:MAG: sodium/proline symporter [Pseudomonadota bacterium]
MGQNQTIIILGTFGAYLVLLLGIGIWGDRRFGQSYEGFVSANKSLGAWVAAISSAASSESAWVMLGLSGLGYEKGLAAYWASLGCIFGFALAAVFVVRQLRTSAEQYDVLTLGDYFVQRLKDKNGVTRYLSATLIAFFLLVYVVAQFVASGKQMVGMQLMGYRSGVMMGALVIGVYVLIGGYAAVCWTDLVQGLLMAIVMIVFPVMALFAAGGISPVIETLKGADSSFWAGGEGLTWGAIGFAVGQLGIGLGYPGMPHSIIRYVTIRNDHEARRAAIITVGYGTIVLLGAATLGIVGRALIPNLLDAEHILPVFTATYFHPIISGLILAAVSAAIMSTADSQLMMAATSLVHDLWYKTSGSHAPLNATTMVLKTRIVIGVLTIIAMGVALIEPQLIYTLVLFAWGALGAAFSPIILLCLHSKLVTWQGAVASFVVGPATIVLWKIFGLSDFVYELIPGAIVSTLVGLLVSRLTQPSISTSNP